MFRYYAWSFGGHGLILCCNTVCSGYVIFLLLPQMITSMEIPHLAEGQTISDYRKIFIDSTATLNTKQQLDCLPLYIHRTEGERQLAFTAATKASQDEAFKFLEDMIDGSPCVFTESASSSFNILPINNTIDGLRSYYFELQEVALRAEISRGYLLNVSSPTSLGERSCLKTIRQK